ncbi:MAG: ATP-binding cassette domain-containing protein, partial [Deltaproteobacteria bacterium]|nr:ATP-binding cassette domain-containing protein [Deltaproteobacteria bacterium]
ERVGLTAAAKRKVRGYSRGMRQRLGLGISILSEPNLLVLDEPTGGLDQEGIAVLFDVLDEWRQAGRMVLIATHDLTLLERRVDRVCILESGRRVALDTPGALREAAGLPVRVTFAVTGDPSAFVAALEAWGGGTVERIGERVEVEASPDGLMALMDIRTEHSDTVTGLRVIEPGMDEVYEHYLAAAHSEAPEAPKAAEA